MQSRPQNGNYLLDIHDKDELLEIRDSLVYQYSKDGDGCLTSIECDIDKRTMKVNGTDFVKTYPELVIEDDIVDLFDDGTRYEGRTLAHIPYGYGLLYDANNHLEYEGFVFDKEKVCYGKQYYSSGSVEYIGYFYNNLKHCYGVSYDRYGKFVYEGYWRRNVIMNDIVRFSDPLEYIHSSAEYLTINGKLFETLVLVVDDFPRLKSLRILRGFFYFNLKVIIQNCRYLEEVYADRFSSFFDSQFRIADCPRLETLHFVHSFKDIEKAEFISILLFILSK